MSQRRSTQRNRAAGLRHWPHLDLPGALCPWVPRRGKGGGVGYSGLRLFAEPIEASPILTARAISSMCINGIPVALCGIFTRVLSFTKCWHVIFQCNPLRATGGGHDSVPSSGRN